MLRRLTHSIDHIISKQRFICLYETRNNNNNNNNNNDNNNNDNNNNKTWFCCGCFVGIQVNLGSVSEED